MRSKIPPSLDFKLQPCWERLSVPTILRKRVRAWLVPCFILSVSNRQVRKVNMPARAVSVHHWSLWTNVCLSKKATFPSLMLQGQLSLAVSLSKVIKASAAPLVYTHWRWIHTVNSLICPAGTQQHIIYGAEPVLCLSHSQHLRLFQSKVPFCTKTKKKNNKQCLYTLFSSEIRGTVCWRTK